MRRVPDAIASKLMSAANRFATGFDDVRMDDIAQVTGIPRATLYYYFAGKDEILTFLMDALLADFSVRAAEVTVTKGLTRSRLLAFVQRYFELIESNPAAAQLIFVNLGRVGKLPDLVAAGDAAFVEPIRRMLEEGVQRGEVASIDVPTAATALFGAVTNVGTSALMIQDAEVDTERLAKDLVDLMWHGIGTTKKRGVARTP